MVCVFFFHCSHEVKHINVNVSSRNEPLLFPGVFVLDGQRDMEMNVFRKDVFVESMPSCYRCVNCEFILNANGQSCLKGSLPLKDFV